MVAMVSVSGLTAMVTPEVPGCPDFVANQAVIQTAIKFCRMSEYWREELAAIGTTAGQSTYTLSPPSAESTIEKVLSVRHNGYVLYPTTEENLDDKLSGWRLITCTQAEGWVSTDRNIVRLVYTPSVTAASAIIAKVVLKPSQTATTIPQFLFDHYADQIASGAKSRLMAMPNVPWSNPALSDYYKQDFRLGHLEAKGVAVDGYNSTVPETYALF